MSYFPHEYQHTPSGVFLCVFLWLHWSNSFLIFLWFWPFMLLLCSGRWLRCFLLLHRFLWLLWSSEKNNYSVNTFKSNNYCSSFWVTFVCRKTACTSINVETWFKIQTQLLTIKHWKHQIMAAKKVGTWPPCFPNKT